MTKIKRTKADTRLAMGMERYLDRRLAHAGGYAKWVETMADKLPPEEQSAIFGVTVQTIYNYRKWWEEWLHGVK